MEFDVKAISTDSSVVKDVWVFQVDSKNRWSLIEETLGHSFGAEKRHGLTVLMADDDFDDCFLAREAWDELQTDHRLRFVHDGQEVLDYIYHKGSYQDQLASPSPALILLDLNMPKKNGFEVLGTLRDDPQLRTIPIIVFTTTKNTSQIVQAYRAGANAFISKPTTYEGYVAILRAIEGFWLTLIELPINKT